MSHGAFYAFALPWGRAAGVPPRAGMGQGSREHEIKKKRRGRVSPCRAFALSTVDLQFQIYTIGLCSTSCGSGRLLLAAEAPKLEGGLLLEDVLGVALGHLGVVRGCLREHLRRLVRLLLRHGREDYVF